MDGPNVPRKANWCLQTTNAINTKEEVNGKMNREDCSEYDTCKKYSGKKDLECEGCNDFKRVDPPFVEESERRKCQLGES